MTFSVTITGDATTFEVYGGLAACQHYLNGRGSSAAVAFRALSGAPDDQARALIAATALIDAQLWQGVPTTPAVGGTTLQWPRTGVVDAKGLAVDSATVPTSLLNGVFELAALFVDDPDLATAIDAGTNLRSVKAGTAAVENFAPTSVADGDATLLPPIVQRWVGQYLGTVEGSGGIVTGADGVSAFDVDDANGADINPFGRSWPL